MKLYKKLSGEILRIIFKDNFFVKMWITFLLFFVVSFLFSNFIKPSKDIDYEKYVEGKDYSIITQKTENGISELNSELSQKEKYDQVVNDFKKNVKQKEIELLSATNVKYNYNPVNFEAELLSNTGVTNISEIIFSKLFENKKLSFDLEFYKSKIDVRGKFIDNKIKLFGVGELSQEEVISVFIHELGHYFDVNYLEKKVLFDLSDNFYKISWKTATILNDFTKKEDFVSGYAMTNKYEDFAESFTYYVLFNDDFRVKMSNSKRLQEKYEFLSKYIFRNDEFKKTNFRTQEKIEPYYWDITRINFSLEFFLDYLKKWI